MVEEGDEEVEGGLDGGTGRERVCECECVYHLDSGAYLECMHGIGWDAWIWMPITYTQCCQSSQCRPKDPTLANCPCQSSPKSRDHQQQLE